MSFIRDFTKTFLYFARSGLLLLVHLTFHLTTKLLHFISFVVVPALKDLLYGTIFVLIIVYQGFCETMTLICISMSKGLIKMGNYFHKQSESLIEKNWM